MSIVKASSLSGKTSGWRSENERRKKDMEGIKRTAVKVMELHDDGVWIVVKKVSDKDRYNPYRIYLRDRNHVRLIAKYADMLSCVCYVREFFMEGLNDKTEEEVVDWSKKRMALY